MKSLRAARTIATLAAILPLASQAAIVTKCGTTICYTYDDAQAAAFYFNQPTLLGDSMRFIPQNFRAESLNGGTVSTSATWVFSNVYSMLGAEIGSVFVREAGDYSISGDSGGAPDTVGVNLYTQVADNASAEFVFDIKNFAAQGDTVGTPVGAPVDWALNSAVINPATAFTAVANNVAISIQNTLSATTDEVGGDAWIQKKFVVEVGTVVPLGEIPVPAAAWLLGSAFGVLTVVRRRAS